MKKLLSAVLLQALVCTLTTAQTNQTKYFDQPVQLKSCNISIKTNHFIATTVMEMEYYNPLDSVVEAYQLIKLNKGQVITGFQLELNGKYRDGSIEEKWKAIRAYSNIVGKRVDPAILEYYYDNTYKLHIYPVPAHGSRKVSMTVDQLMKSENGKLDYSLPLAFSSVTEKFRVNIEVMNKGSVPLSNTGFLSERSFTTGDHYAVLSLQIDNVILNKPVSFSIPVSRAFPQVCISTDGNAKHFVTRVFPGLLKTYPVKPSTVAVYWDVSASSTSRDLRRELDFLRDYILRNEISSVSITLFNQKIVSTHYLDTHTTSFSVLSNFLSTYPYGGATNFESLDLSAVKADAILVFSDGINSLGGSCKGGATVQVNCITSSATFNRQQLDKIISNTGGSVINLFNVAIPAAMNNSGQAINYLVRYNSTMNTVRLNEKFPLELNDAMLVSGSFEGNEQLQLVFGNNASVNKIENINLQGNEYCDNDTYRKVRLLVAYDSLMQKGYWYDFVYFGLQEKVVTPRTSYLVLERIEDYINYNIAPPKELEEACAERNYVYKSEYKIKALKQQSQQEILASAVNNYNRYINWWDPKAELINLDKPVTNSSSLEIEKTNNVNSNSKISNPLLANTPGKTTELAEVVVTGAFNTKRTARSMSSNVQNVNAEQLNTIRQQNLNDALAGKIAGMQIRSQSAAKLGAGNIVRLRGENGIGIGSGPIYVVNGTIISSVQDINVDDINDVTVLQGPAAAALFGADGANGAIVINMKRGRWTSSYNSWSSYRLKDMPDDDYLCAIKRCKNWEKDEVYSDLAQKNEGIAGFYFDMAEYFFADDRKEKAASIMMDGIEACKGNVQGLLAAAYIYESWKYFDEAIGIYKNILQSVPANLVVKRDLALAYYQKGNYQQAVQAYYEIVNREIITSDHVYYNDADMKTIALNEMNAVIALHRDKLELGFINPNLIRTMPLDLRVTVESNNGYADYITFATRKGSKVLSTSAAISGNQDDNWYYNSYSQFVNEYAVKDARNETYKVNVNSYNWYSPYKGSIPVYVRTIIFRNFQKTGQTLEIQRVSLENQYGNVEIAEILK